MRDVVQHTRMLERFYGNYSHLSPEKARLLERLLEDEAIALSDLLIQPQPRDRRFYSLSAAQARIFFFEKLRSVGAVFNLPSVVHLRGSVDIDLLRRAVERVVERQEALRLSFHVEAAQLVQAISPEVEVPMATQSLRELSAHARPAALQQAIDEEIREPFDLAKAPLFRVKVIEAESDEWYIVFTLHHLIADDWSIRILVRETGKNYHWLVRGEPNRMPPLPIQYIDYAHWERRNLTAEKCASSLAYWRQHFGPTLPRLRLPTDFRRPTRPKFRGALHNFTLDQALLTRLKQTARSQQCTLFMVLVLAYQWLLSRKSGRADIPVAVPVTSRQRFEVENLIGLFANTLLMYTRVDPEHTVAEALKSVQRIALQAYANQALPFDELVRALRDSRTAVDGVMYDVGFQILDHRNESHDILGFEEGTWEVPRSLPFDLVVDAQIAKCDLFLCAWEVDGRLVCSAEFDVDLFKRSTIVSWMTEYEGLLGFIATDVTRRLREHAVG